MKKVLSLLSLVTLFLVTGGMKAMAASVDDLVAISSDYTFIADKITSDGTAKLVANTLYDENRIFAPTANSVATNKGSSTIGGEEHLNSLRLKNTQDQLIFKVARPCTVKFYTQSHNSRGIQVGSKAGGTEYGSQTASTTEWECQITQPGLVYLSSYGGDFFFAGFEVTFAPLTATFENDANWAAVFAYTWSGADESKVEHLGAWPGTQLTETDGKYVVSIKSENVPENIIFNDGGTNQTADLEFKDGGVYKSTGRVVEKKDFTVNFKTDAAWTTVYAYTWTGEEKQLGAWPGTAMTKVSDGEWTVTVNAEEAPASIIFHNNEGTQTADLTFEADKTYEYNLNTYTATFTTDGEWANVYAYAWSGSGDAVVKLTGDYPGQKLEAADGVYTFTYKAFAAPEMILFNDGGDTNKTPDMGFTNGRAYKWNTTLKPLFTLEASETNITAGTTLNVVDAVGDVVGYFTYGVEGGADFAAPTARQSDEYAAFVNYTAGNGENGTATSGTVYYIKPIYDGSVTVGVWLNGGKSFYIQEDGTSLAGFDGYKQDYGSGTAFTFNVKGGSTYAVYCTGSKLGFYGFDYTFTKPEPVKNTYTATFTNAANWAEVYAYAWTTTGEGEQAVTTKFLGDWPGKKLEAGEDGKFVATIEAEAAPAFIIFNNGAEGEAAAQTEDLAFEDKKEYTNAAPDPVKNTYTATLANEAGWENVYAYAWTTTGEGEQAVTTKFLGDWPGKKLEAGEDGKFVATIEAEAAPAFIIFNNGAEGEAAAQTEDLAFEDKKEYTNKVVEPAKQTYTATFTTTAGWEKVFAYAWYVAPEGEVGEAILTANWPGNEITATKDENGVYTFTLESALKPSYIIFNNGIEGEGAAQTADFVFEQGQKYEFVAPEVPAEDIEIKPESGDIAAALAAAIDGKKVGDITIRLNKDAQYTIGATLTVPNSLFFYGNDATVTVAEEMTDNFITLNGTEAVVTWTEGEDTKTNTDHKFIKSVEVRGVTIKGLKGALVKDNQKTLVENLVIDYANIEMPAAGKNVIDFNGKGYVGKVTVTNSTIWANGMNTGFFAQYGSRPKNINGDWLQEFDIENSTIVNIANGKNICDVKQNGTAQNVYTLKNNIFVDCGKGGQTVVGFNKGQASATPTWAVTGNYFAITTDGVITNNNAAEIAKAGKVGENDIVQNCVEGTLTFTDAAAGDFNGEFQLAEGATAPEALGAPIWTITYKAAPVPTDYYLVGNMTEWTVNENYKLTKNENAGEGAEEYMITLSLAADAQFKIVKAEGEGENQELTWYPDGIDNNYGQNGEIKGAGESTVYFRPNRDGGDDWFHGYIYVTGAATGINSIAIDQKLKDAEIYNLNGQRVLNAKKGLYIVNGRKVVIK